MTIFITGMFRSGSTWSFNAVRELVSLRYPRERIHIAARNDTALSFLEADERCEVILMKSHLLDGTGESLIRAKGAKAVHSFRDPPDAIRSGMHAFHWSFEHCLGYVARSFELMDLIMQAQNGLLIFYEDIERIPVQIVTTLSEYIEIPAGRETIDAICHKLRAESLKCFTDAMTQRTAFEADRKIVDLGFSYYDFETLLHRSHISSRDYLESIQFDEPQRCAMKERFGSRTDAMGLLRLRQSTLYSHSRRIGGALTLDRK